MPHWLLGQCWSLTCTTEQSEWMFDADGLFNIDSVPPPEHLSFHPSAVPGASEIGPAPPPLSDLSFQPSTLFGTPRVAEQQDNGLIALDL